MRIKERPEDFIVEEIGPAPEEKGRYWLYRAIKRDLTTQEMIRRLSKASGLEQKEIRYAGLKDRRAVTSQYITAPKPLRTAPDVTLNHVGYRAEHLHLGAHGGNRFTIRVREVKKTRDLEVPNYFGDQRFSTHNVELGLKLLKGEYAAVAEHLAQKYPRIKDYARSGPIGMLQHAPHRLLLIYIHAVQSMLYNEAVSAWVRENTASHIEVAYRHGMLAFPNQPLPDMEVPLVGAAQELGEWERYYAPLFAEHQITPASFMIRSLPTLTQEGTTRSLRMPIRHKELHEEGRDVVLELELGPGAYATVCIAAWCV